MSTENDDRTPASGATKDRATSTPGFILFWGIPIAMVLSVNFLGLSAFASQSLVIAGLVWMGLACLLNARRYGRVHCLFTGPWFILGAAVLTVDLIGILPLSNDQSTLVTNITFAGALALWFLSERIWGKYREKSPTAPKSGGSGPDPKA